MTEQRATDADRERAAEQLRRAGGDGRLTVGAELDLNDVELAADDVTITVFSLMGGSEIHVPEDLRVEISDLGIMGGNEIQRGAPEAERHDGPVVRLKLISILGGTSVRRGPKLTWRQRREKRRQGEWRDERGR